MQIPQTVSDEVHGAVLRGAPTAALVGVSASGWGPQEVIWALTGLLLVLQCAYLIWKWRKEAKQKSDTEWPDDASGI
jgi:uncharacterized membrane protein YfcA